MARLQEIEERLSAIKAEMNTEGANLDALGTEVDNLIACLLYTSDAADE